VRVFVVCSREGPIAQLRLERTPDKREVGSSTLPRPTRVNWGIGRVIIPEFLHSQLITGGVAQLGERLPCTQEVIGSNPFTSTRGVMSDQWAAVGGTRSLVTGD
jgi:hypothetical protein